MKSREEGYLGFCIMDGGHSDIEIYVNGIYDTDNYLTNGIQRLCIY